MHMISWPKTIKKARFLLRGRITRRDTSLFKVSLYIFIVVLVGLIDIIIMLFVLNVQTTSLQLTTALSLSLSLCLCLSLHLSVSLSLSLSLSLPLPLSFLHSPIFRPPAAGREGAERSAVHWRALGGNDGLRIHGGWRCRSMEAE